MKKKSQLLPKKDEEHDTSDDEKNGVQANAVDKVEKQEKIGEQGKVVGDDEEKLKIDGSATDAGDVEEKLKRDGSASDAGDEEEKLKIDGSATDAGEMINPQSKKEREKMHMARKQNEPKHKKSGPFMYIIFL